MHLCHLVVEICRCLLEYMICEINCTTLQILNLFKFLRQTDLCTMARSMGSLWRSSRDGFATMTARSRRCVTITSRASWTPSQSCLKFAERRRNSRWATSGGVKKSWDSDGVKFSISVNCFYQYSGMSFFCTSEEWQTTYWTFSINNKQILCKFHMWLKSFSGSLCAGSGDWNQSEAAEKWQGGITSSCSFLLLL